MRIGLCVRFAAVGSECESAFDKHLQEVQNTALRFGATTRGDVAQLGEHHVRNVGVVGSNPIISTMVCPGRKGILLFRPSALCQKSAENGSVKSFRASSLRSLSGPFSLGYGDSTNMNQMWA